VPDGPPSRLAAFVRDVWGILEPGTVYRHGRVIDAIAEGFNWLARRQHTQQVQIVAPVQVGAGPSEYTMSVRGLGGYGNPYAGYR
jgi:hypothetical protein